MEAKEKRELPLDIYIPFVESLFRDGASLIIGVFAQAITAAILYHKTGHPIYLVIGALLLVIGGARYISVVRVRRRPPMEDRVEATRREAVYIVGGVLHAFMLGMLCFISVYIVNDAFAEVASIAITLASLSSVAGRNYGSQALVMLQIIAASGPLSLALIISGDIYNIVLGLLSLPFLIAVRRFAAVARGVLLTALLEKRKVGRLAERFNRALNTMSYGLVMIAPDGKVIVANAEAARLLAFANPEAAVGRSLHSLLTRGVAAGSLSLKSSRKLERHLVQSLASGSDERIVVTFSDGRCLEFAARSGNGELAVITFEDVTQRVQAEEKIRTIARIDGLTGLPNRTYFQEIVGTALKAGDPKRLCGLVLFDLDDFKGVNDTLGHPVGDGLIQAVGKRLSAFSGKTIRISRFGGDEFMIYFDEIENRELFVQTVDSIFGQLQGGIDASGHFIHLQASAGAVCLPVDGVDFDSLVVKADLALHRAKTVGKGSWQMFETDMDEAFRNRQIRKAELRTAVETGSLRVVYQPIVSIESMRIAGCEALCRWDHPVHGAISPAEFIPMAEEMGIISDITAFMLDTACRDCVNWPSELNVSVNLSARDLRSFEIVGRVREVLKNTRLAPERLELEVTETAFIADKKLSDEVISRLKELGVKIALDDFGTGYSSLSYIHKLPFDKIKIDRSFISDIHNSRRSLELVRGIITLSRSLGMEVTVEGVETFEQLKILQARSRPDLLQGFLFGAALTATGISAMSQTRWSFADDRRKKSLALNK
ncbi:putative bifunctional diguanylate cyclase/phosphodiesterase [Limoniibacter endophyticus]|uniref:Diguanylate cyclase n=1 Tax=Limoniibacter endophyticus TaxID=1565040 RepID=A0A8J3DG98_9HYPH|nr:EAL domain-containing protein [Limoniibacter endophyticus]GHC63952.1 diguanylate cyclase [Limoniibacter endophyticus]